jgi:hypothetical protein
LTGRTLTGNKAPTEQELQQWLEENPTFEVLKVHHVPEASKLFNNYFLTHLPQKPKS